MASIRSRIGENMTESEATEKLRAYSKCIAMRVKGIYEDCNNKSCIEKGGAEDDD